MNRRWITLAACAAVGGCMQSSGVQTGQLVGGGTLQVANAQVVDGFLPKPELLTTGGNGRPDMVYLKPGENFHAYTALLVDPIVIVSGPASQLATATPEQRDALANTYYSDLHDTLGKHCKLTDKAGPGVIEMRFALTDAKSSNGAVKTVATYAPYVSGLYTVASLGFNNGVGYFAGTATSETYATDSVSGELLWEAVDARGGTTSFVTNSLDNWLDVHKAFQAWADEVAAKLKTEGVCVQ